MSPDQQFARWVKVALAAFVVLFAYFILADSFMPLTPEARVLRPVVSIAPELSAPVERVQIHEQQRVSKGDVLFSLDAEPFEIAVEEANLMLEQARQENAQLEANLAAAQADLSSAQALVQEKRSERQRGETLVARQSLSRQNYESLVAAAQTAEADVRAAEAAITSLEVQLGEEGDANLRLRQARNQLARARLDLEHTEVRAQQAGTVTNLQLQAGSYVQAGQPVIAMVSDTLDIVADFREKSVRHLHLGDPAEVIFDSLPGQIFPAHVTNIEAGVLQGQQAANGQLTDIPTTNRWVRDAQRLRVHILLDEPLAVPMATGARASVQLVPGDAALAKPFAWLQAHLVSWLHFVY
ncbi:HlyD family secretion protein [Halomonas dongshanensis]|uniref:HlyD family secretion protein n=1 Tax=Halomonas dongshanensis TaxID=2890835 RepID=A0ABT2EDK0_9GAMM|nr:HlyD family secretion protein [Halomonas dongshanensis]MCS2609564.1 HlyD family secretion protein [Halomonas dongshanensis]